MAKPIIVDVDHVTMRFNIAKEKVDSFKEWFIRKIKGNLHVEEFFAVKDVTLKIEQGDVYGLVGLNGSGKSTLLKIIAGVMKPTKGKCTVKGTIAPLIELGAGFDPELTGRENVFLNGTVLGMNPSYLQKNYKEIVEFSELGDFMEVPVKNYSSGMVARLAFSIATVTKPDVLICDEILSVGDFLFQQKCEARMQELMSGGTTVIIVSHDTDQIERLCNKVAWMRRGKLVMDGSCEEVCLAYRAGAQEMRERE